MDLRQMLVGDVENLAILHTFWKFAVVSWVIGMIPVLIACILLRQQLQGSGSGGSYMMGIIWSVPVYIVTMMVMLMGEPLLIFHGQRFHRAEEFPSSLLSPWITGHMVVAFLIILVAASWASNNDRDGEAFIIAGSFASPVISMGLLLLGTLQFPKIFTLDTILVLSMGTLSLVGGTIAIIVIFFIIINVFMWALS